MALVNEHFLKLPGSYLFSDIAKKVNSFRITHPKQEVIRLGIGDVTRPLPPVCIEAMHKAVEEMADARTFRGYGPEQGYDFLIEAIIKHDYLPRGIHFGSTEIFVNDGAKSDTGNIGDILRHDNSVGVTDPIYPVYIDSNVMCGRAGVLEENGQWSNVTYMPCTAENNFIPEIPGKRIDIVYLCYPNNPTGTTLTKSELKKWVDYALANDTLILFDAAYEAFIREEDVPHSIYEIKGAKKCAIEFRSFSKTAGFTGVRCGYTVVPKELTAATLEGERIPLNKLWNRRQCTKFNGTGYITQRAAEAIYTPEGQRQIKETIDYYMKIQEKIDGLEQVYRAAQFKKWLDSAKVVCRESYTLPQVITPAETIDSIPYSLYEAEKNDMNPEERSLIDVVVGLGNVKWWHRIIERKGFRINGNINHYPDFMIMTKAGKLVLIEFKGDDRDNSDSKMKLELGRQWQAQAGANYRYFMVFKNKDFGIDGAYRLDDFVEIMKEL